MRKFLKILCGLVLGIFLLSCQHNIRPETTDSAETLAKVDISEQITAQKKATKFIQLGDFSGLNRTREDDREL